MRRLYLILIFVLFFFLFTSTVFAESSYVLPYPSSMPGSSLYKVHILFEYKQYLLAYKALEKSNNYFLKLPSDLKKAQGSGKNIIEKENIFYEASRKHVEILKSLKIETPESFVWRPEKGSQSNLAIHKLIDISIKLRQSVL